jgi:hypothetical protein
MPTMCDTSLQACKPALARYPEAPSPYTHSGLTPAGTRKLVHVVATAVHVAHVGAQTSQVYIAVALRNFLHNRTTVDATEGIKGKTYIRALSYGLRPFNARCSTAGSEP